MSKQLLRSAKNVMNGYSPAQVLVRNATSNEEYGPSLDQMEELAERTYSAVEFFEIMIILEKRLSDKPKNWRHVAKSLTVVDFLVRAGAETCVDWARENIFLLRKLTEFMHMEEMTGIEHGQLIRVKAKELISLLLDEERLREERSLRLGRNKRNRSASQLPNQEDTDAELQRALEESRITAEEEERRRKQAEMDQMDDEELRTALQLSKEEEELRKLRELQQQRDQRLAFWQQQQQQQQQQPMYYDIFGNPISFEEYLQFQQQQEQAQQQQAQQQVLAQQLAEQQAAEQQYYAQQQYLAQQQQQQYLAQQQMLAQQQLKTGPNNPFSLENVNKLNSDSNRQQQPQQPVPTTFGAGFNAKDNSPMESSPAPNPVIQQPSSQQSSYSQPQQPLTATRTGNQSITDKYGELNELLASGTGLDTFGNTGQTRIPAQHTKTGTFINSQGTGYKQVGPDASKHNPFLTSQYTGLPSTNIAPSHTGYGFGNNPSYNQNANKPSDQGMSLIDL